MTETTFWALIAMLNWGATGDDDAVVAPVVEELSQMSTEDIQRFDDILASKLHALDTKSHASEIGEDAYVEGEYFSADWFLYARCAVVANGSELFNSVLNDPTMFPKDIEFESLLNVASTAYEQKTGEEYKYSPEPSYETYSNKGGWH
jgi:hypothetical protein